MDRHRGSSTTKISTDNPSNGDVIGCLWQIRDSSVTFTRNGELLAGAQVSFSKNTKRLFAAIQSDSSHERLSFRVNAGQSAFRYVTGIPAVKSETDQDCAAQVAHQVAALATEFAAEEAFKVQQAVKHAERTTTAQSILDLCGDAELTTEFVLFCIDKHDGDADRAAEAFMADKEGLKRKYIPEFQAKSKPDTAVATVSPTVISSTPPTDTATSFTQSAVTQAYSVLDTTIPSSCYDCFESPDDFQLESVDSSARTLWLNQVQAKLSQKKIDSKQLKTIMESLKAGGEEAKMIWEVQLEEYHSILPKPPVSTVPVRASGPVALTWRELINGRRVVIAGRATAAVSGVLKQQPLPTWYTGATMESIWGATGVVIECDRVWFMHYVCMYACMRVFMHMVIEGFSAVYVVLFLCC
jgi:hypothetical protein